MSLLNIASSDLQSLLSRRTVSQLKDMAKNLGLKVLSKFKKQELVNIIYEFEINRRKATNTANILDKHIEEEEIVPEDEPIINICFDDTDSE